MAVAVRSVGRSGSVWAETVMTAANARMIMAIMAAANTAVVLVVSWFI